MNKLQHLLLVGHSRADLNELQILLAKLPGIKTELRVLEPSQFDPLQNITQLPDVLLLDVGMQGQNMLKAVLNRPAPTRPVILIIGPDTENADLMRLAMQAGARDFFRKPYATQDLLSAIRQIVRESDLKIKGEVSKLSVIMSAKGGTGASFLACNLAHLMASRMDIRALLVDMDMQFGSQAMNLDLKPEQGIFELLKEIDHLDLVALDVFFTKHRSELRLLSRLPDQIGLLGDVPVAKLGQFLDLALTGFDHIVVDLPHMIDPTMTAFAERADHFLICIEQNVVNLRDAQRLMLILQQELDLDEDRIKVVVNRYHRDAHVKLQDIQDTLNIESVYCIPNDYKRVVTSIDLGRPLAQSAPQAPITQTLSELAGELCGTESNLPKGRLAQLLARLSPGA
jgi:pilus assembly protein CpaE